MAYREDAIKGLECCTIDVRNCPNKCPYGKIKYCELELMKDALKLLKEQQETINSFQHTINALNKGIAEQAKEPVKPTVDEFGNAYCICGENVGFIPQNDKTLPKVLMNYCDDCGRKLVWE